MPIKCSNCGALIKEKQKFCTECAAAVIIEEQQQQATQQPEQEQITQQQQPVQLQFTPPIEPIYAAPVHNTNIRAEDAPPPKGSKNATVSTLGFVGWRILMYIPVVGLIITIILAFSKGNVNIRNFARSSLVFAIMGFIFAVVTGILMWSVITQILLILSESIEINFGF